MFAFRSRHVEVALTFNEYDWPAIQTRYDQNVPLRAIVVEFGCAWATIQKARDRGLFIPRGKNDLKKARSRTLNRRKNQTCRECGSRLKSGKSVFCSTICHKSEQSRVYIQRWLLGLETGTTPSGCLSKTIKKYVLEVAGYKCSNESCGFFGVNPVTGKSVIQVDHVDGNCVNNSFGNLRCLCPNCHSLTPNFGKLNMGKGRKSQKIATMNGANDRFIGGPKMITILNRSKKYSSSIEDTLCS